MHMIVLLRGSVQEDTFHQEASDGHLPGPGTAQGPRGWEDHHRSVCKEAVSQDVPRVLHHHQEAHRSEGDIPENQRTQGVYHHNLPVSWYNVRPVASYLNILFDLTLKKLVCVVSCHLF